MQNTNYSLNSERKSGRGGVAIAVSHRAVFDWEVPSASPDAIDKYFAKHPDRRKANDEARQKILQK